MVTGIAGAADIKDSTLDRPRPNDSSGLARVARVA